MVSWTVGTGRLCDSSRTASDRVVAHGVAVLTPHPCGLWCERKCVYGVVVSVAPCGPVLLQRGLVVVRRSARDETIVDSRKRRINVTRCRSPFPFPLLARLSGNATFQRMPRYQVADKRSRGFSFTQSLGVPASGFDRWQGSGYASQDAAVSAAAIREQIYFYWRLLQRGVGKINISPFRPSGSKVRRIVGTFLWRYGAAVDDPGFRLDRWCGDDTERSF